DEAIVLVYQERMTPNPGFERLKIPFLKTGSYQLTSRKQYFNIRAFGSLVNEALPINLTVNSTLFNTIANRYLFEANQFKQTVHSDTLQHYGITLPHEFTSTGYNAHVMPLPDHYSHLFILKKISEGETHDNN
ncbi:MAG: hypothetical protein K9L26_03050, partial [Candidatus Izimaplasma sp.]|nr:hypothetical protein [Candidatus Izimaplasma bacterium]